MTALVCLPAHRWKSGQCEWQCRVGAVLMMGLPSHTLSIASTCRLKLLTHKLVVCAVRGLQHCTANLAGVRRREVRIRSVVNMVVPPVLDDLATLMRAEARPLRRSLIASRKQSRCRSVLGFFVSARKRQRRLTHIGVDARLSRLGLVAFRFPAGRWLQGAVLKFAYEVVSKR